MEKKTNLLDNILITLSALFFNCYIFLGHFNFPFVTTWFLYIAVFFLLCSVFFKKKIVIDKGNIYLLLILIVMIIGCFYTKDLNNAIRQSSLFLIYGLIYLIVKQKDEKLSNKFVQIYYCFSFIILLTVYLQFLYPDMFNSFLKEVLSNDNYLSIMNAYNIDKSFVGLSPSVTVTSFSLGVLMFTSGINFFSCFFNKNKKNSMKKVDVVIFVLSLFGIIITNKRGIFISSTIAFLLSIFLNKDISIKKITNTKLVVMIFSILFIISAVSIIFSNNNNIDHFIGRFKGDNLLTGRETFYDNAITDLNNNGAFSWLFGFGTGSAYIINDTGLHNVYLQIIYDHGIIGLFIFILFFLYNLKSSIKKICNERFVQLAVQISFLIYCLSGNPLYSYYIMIPYLIFCSYEVKRKEE